MIILYRRARVRVTSILAYLSFAPCPVRRL
jgi:hypothetical protein